MSSPKAARAVRRAKLAARPAKAAVKPASRSKHAATTKPVATEPAAGADPSATATRLAAALESALAAGTPDALTKQALQTLMAAVCRIYAAQIEAGHDLTPVASRSLSSTDVMLTASGLLRSSNLAVFELGMWQSWTGR